MKRLINWLYVKYVYMPEFHKRMREIHGGKQTPTKDGVVITYDFWDTQIIPQAERERKLISDDRLH